VPDKNPHKNEAECTQKVELRKAEFLAAEEESEGCILTLRAHGRAGEDWFKCYSFEVGIMRPEAG